MKHSGAAAQQHECRLSVPRPAVPRLGSRFFGAAVGHAGDGVVSRETLRIGQNGVFHVKHSGAAAEQHECRHVGPGVRQFHGLGHAFSVLICGSMPRQNCFT